MSLEFVNLLLLGVSPLRTSSHRIFPQPCIICVMILQMRKLWLREVRSLAQVGLNQEPNLFSLSSASLLDPSSEESSEQLGSPLSGRNLGSNRCFYSNQLPKVHINAESLNPDPEVPRLQY